MLPWDPKDGSLENVLSGLMRGGAPMQWGSGTSSVSLESRSSLEAMQARGAALMVILGELGSSGGKAEEWAGAIFSSSFPGSANVLTVRPLGLFLSSNTGAEKLMEPSGATGGSLGLLVPGREWWDEGSSGPQELVTNSVGDAGSSASLVAWP